MCKETSVWIITTLAIYQTKFWVEVAIILRKEGVEVAFVSFDDRSTDYLHDHDFDVYSVNDVDQAFAGENLGGVGKVFSEYGVSNPNYWLTHERFAFDLYSSDEMTIKFLTYLSLYDRCFNSIDNGKKISLIQELGGFVSVVAGFFSARKANIDNWFIEPSFFKGRMLFLKNTFSALDISGGHEIDASGEVVEYLKSVQAKKTIVVPLKDKHHYSAAFSKIFNIKNVIRLVEKTYDKYFLGKHQEFGHISSHVTKHVKMAYNSLALSQFYSSLSDIGSFIYYPLHVPGDMALTLRSPEFLDQLGLIDYLVRNLPSGYKLAIKEHPAMIGAIDAGRIRQLLRRYDQLVLINPSENNYDVLAQCSGVISVNSKSGAEGILLNKPVFVLGDAFYRNCPMAITVEHLTSIDQILEKNMLEFSPYPEAELASYFEKVWRCTFVGELYISESENVEAFSCSMVAALAEKN